MMTATSATSADISDLQLPDSEKLTTGGNSRFVRFLAVALPLLVAGGGYIAYLRNPPWLQAVRGAEYDTATVISKGRDEVALELSGFVVPYRKVNISPRIPGTITQLPIDVGQKVKKGDLLAQLDDASYQADMQQAEAAVQVAQSALDEAENGAQPEEFEKARTALDAAKAKLAYATKEVERSKLLPDSTPAAEMDKLLSLQNDAQAQVTTLDQTLKLLEKGARPERLKGIEGQVKQAEALVAKAKYLLDNARITAPMDGTVLDKNAEVGEILRPEGLTTSLCILADLSVMEVEVDVQERDLHKIDVGRPCKIIPDAYSDREYLGKIDRIQPQVNRQRGVVRVTIRIDEPDDHLLSEMNVRALILNPPSDEPVAESLWIPEAAVTRRDGNAWVFVLQDDRAVRRDVELGDSEGKRTKVTSGLAKDDVVVLAGDKRLVDGQTIRLKKSAK
jgi:multidrug efflux pump subunit AcrA (membrane-fusion protein)